jgi:hypothetical protein
VGAADQRHFRDVNECALKLAAEEDPNSEA